jgi:hypothetical protein
MAKYKEFKIAVQPQMTNKTIKTAAIKSVKLTY